MVNSLLTFVGVLVLAIMPFPIVATVIPAPRAEIHMKDLLRIKTTTPPPANPVPVPETGLTGKIELRDAELSYGSPQVSEGASKAP
jgi:hypothetical protein